MIWYEDITPMQQHLLTLLFLPMRRAYATRIYDYFAIVKKRHWEGCEIPQGNGEEVAVEGCGRFWVIGVVLWTRLLEPLGWSLHTALFPTTRFDAQMMGYIYTLSLGVCHSRKELEREEGGFRFWKEGWLDERQLRAGGFRGEFKRGEVAYLHLRGGQ